MTTDVNKVATLINKLLALSKDGGATEAEAALAAEKAQALMTEHNLSMANIEASGGKSGDEGQRVKDGIGHKQVYKWQRTLMAALADLNFCFCREVFERHAHTRSFDGYQLIGRAANVASTRVMFEYLLQSIDRLAKAEVQDPTQFFTRYAHSFKEGCADRVVERLRARRAEEVAAAERKKREDAVRNSHPGAATSNALVVVLGDYVQDEQDLNTDFKYNLPSGTTKRKREEYGQKQVAARVQYERRKLELKAVMPDADDEEIGWRASGFSEETVQRWLHERAKERRPETDRQRQKRIEREQRENERWHERMYRQSQRLDSKGYTRGTEAGKDIGLDQQVGKSATKSIT